MRQTLRCGSGSRRHASSRSARRPLLRLRVTAAAVRAPPVSLQASCAYTLVFFWMAEMSAQCVGHLARFFMMRSADWMPASQCVWSPRSPYTLVPALRLRVDTLAIWPEMKARNATWLGLMLSAWRTQGQGGARSAVVAQPGSRRWRGATARSALLLLMRCGRDRLNWLRACATR